MLKLMMAALVPLLLMTDAGEGADHDRDDERTGERGGSGSEDEGDSGGDAKASLHTDTATTGHDGSPGNADGQASGDSEGSKTSDDDRRDELTELTARLERRDAALAKANGRLSEAHAELETLRTFVAGQIAAAKEDLPEPLLAFDPGEESGLEARLAWLETAREQAGKFNGEPQPGNGADPRPGGPTERTIPSPVPLRNMF